MTKPIVTPGGDPADDINSRLRRRTIQMALAERAVTGHILTGAASDISSQVVSAGSSPGDALTGMTVTITPPPGTVYVCQIAGGTGVVTAASARVVFIEIYDGSSSLVTNGQQLVVDEGGNVSIAWVQTITATTTYTLRGWQTTGNWTKARSYLAVLAVPQPDGFSSTLKPITWYVNRGARDEQAKSVVGLRLIRSAATLNPHSANHYLIRAGIQREGRFDWLASFDSATQVLNQGIPYDLTSGAGLDIALRADDILTCEITRYGNPDRLEGTTLEWALDLTGG